MNPACLTAMFGAVAGPIGDRAGAEPVAEPPTPTFQEWVDAIVADEERVWGTRDSTAVPRSNAGDE